eukprot:Rhum_TRINITY_DN5459_c0_g1::Rhum_TRINITY_DN5459_c0_g1_i1::g.17314::m.17314
MKRNNKREKERAMSPALLLVHPAVDGLGGQLLLNAQELVVLGGTLATARRAGLDLTRAQTDNEVRNVRVLGLTRPVRHHDGPAVLPAHLRRVDRLRDRADLVDLEQERVARVALDRLRDALHVRHRQVVADHLGRALQLLRQDGPRLPVVLTERVLDRDERVLLRPALVRLRELLSGHERARLALEGQVVLLGVLVPHLRRGAVHADLDLALVAGLLDRLHQQLQRLLTVLAADGRGEAALVADVHGVHAVLLLQDGLQLVVRLRAHAHRLREGRRAGGGDHVLLERQGVAGVASAVDHVEARHREAHAGLVAGKLRQVLVQREASVGRGGLGDGHRHTEDGVGAELALVRGAVELAHELVEGLLVHDALARQGAVQRRLHGVHGLLDTLAQVARLVAVPLLAGLPLARRRTAGHDAPEHAVGGVQLDLHRGVSTGVKDLTGVQLGDGGHFGAFLND